MNRQCFFCGFPLGDVTVWKRRGKPCCVVCAEGVREINPLCPPMSFIIGFFLGSVFVWLLMGVL